MLRLHKSIQSIAPVTEYRHRRRARGRRALLASFTAMSFLAQNAAWAVCADGSIMPANGYFIGQAPVQVADNWAPGVFSGTVGSIFVPDNSQFEHNDPALPLTAGGHNWVFDQRASLCKMTDTGPAGGVATGWKIPPSNLSECVVLPIITGGKVTGAGDIPGQGQAITPTCDLNLLADHTNNTYFNQLGCAISHAVATTPASATTFVFVAGVRSGLFSIPLTNANADIGGAAGKVALERNYYSGIPDGQKLSTAAVSPDGMFAIATSNKRAQQVYACLKPLGDPGDPALGAGDAKFNTFDVALGAAVKCMSVGNNGLQTDLTTTFGPDGQPYFGGQRFMDTFGAPAGGTFPNTWPQCITGGKASGMAAVIAAFEANSAGGCGTAVMNTAFSSAVANAPAALISHGSYMYLARYPAVGQGQIIQIKVGKDPSHGYTKYRGRNYLNGVSLPTGIGVADDLKSLFVMADPSLLGLYGREIITKVPLCEDM
jgi:hypothetical protein